MLFSMMCHALQSYRRHGEELLEYEGSSSTIAELYRVRAAQCITIADMTKPTKFMVETMFLYAMAEYSDECDGDVGSWLLSGTIFRLAIQQGYHRDPAQHPSLSIFDAEMRRRVWLLVVMYELFSAVKIGLPKGSRFSESDTRKYYLYKQQLSKLTSIVLPRTVYEEELYEDMQALPASRPITEDTPISYLIAKYRIMHAYGSVIELLHCVQQQQYQEIMKLDNMLMEARESLPPHLQVRPLEEMQNDPASRIMERCVLNQAYLPPAYEI